MVVVVVEEVCLLLCWFVSIAKQLCDLRRLLAGF